MAKAFSGVSRIVALVRALEQGEIIDKHKAESECKFYGYAPMDDRTFSSFRESLVEVYGDALLIFKAKDGLVRCQLADFYLPDYEEDDEESEEDKNEDKPPKRYNSIWDEPIWR